jgi:AhpD family alkylhydroperoxidase
MTRLITAALVAAATALPAAAEDAQAARDDIAATMGGVPTFISQIADTALPGIWLEAKQLEFSGDTALDSKTKALISLAVAAQIPCAYCVWLDTNSARAAGATDQQIAEAVAIAGLTRNMSAQFYGLQVDFDQLKAEMSGN